jgi:hypothetical protein
MIQLRVKGAGAWTAWLLTIALLPAGARAGGAERTGPQLPSPGPQAQKASPELDEVVVLGKKLSQMRQEIRELEVRFDSKYNELNTIPDFNVQCVEEAPTGSRFLRHVCKPEYVARAELQEATDFVGGRPIVPAQLVTAMRREEYRKHMIEVVASNPDLLRLLKERRALQQRYEKASKERFKGHWILFE